MLFSDTIPEKLKEYPYVSAFMGVLDSLQNFKHEILASALRSNNSGILMDKKWLLKKLSDFGVTNFPVDFPIQIIRQYLLNVDTVCRTRGSKIGVELYCSLLSLGEVSINDEDFYALSDLLILDSNIQGFITGDNSNPYFYLCGDNESINKQITLDITIKSKYFNGDYPYEANLIKSYIESTINDQLGFSPNKKVNFTYQERDDFYFHKLLNPYFV